MFRFLQKVFCIYLFLSRYFVVDFLKLKVVVGQTVCKMQIIVARLFLYIWKLLLNVGRILSPHLMMFYVHAHMF